MVRSIKQPEQQSLLFTWVRDSISMVRIHLLVSLLLFTIFLSIGYDISITEIESTSSSTYQNVKSEDPVFYISNNLVVVVVVGFLTSGVFTLGLTTLANLVLNGLSLGNIIATANASGIPLYTVGLMILVHGIIEIPALLISSSVGLYVPHQILSYISGDKDYILSAREVTNIITLTASSTFLIIMAGFIEAWVTPEVVKLATV